ncbi:MAG: [FeFe] hydrogenase H-cluster maturation GTPase HydF [Firmicutes bacterium]|nr:[FeFe] hydrogenase H-cluster maturation GTPase HydF [Bacillota bacterium]
MQTTPRGNRLHIALFGRRNVGKSSIINAITGQDIALVSPVPGTTTDPVFKAMEIPPLGPVVLIDTAGLDDEGSLGELRVKRSRRVLQQADMVLLVLEAGSALTAQERELLELCQEKKLPVVAAVNKIDKQNFLFTLENQLKELDIIAVPVSALTGAGITALKIALIRSAPKAWDDRPLAGDLLEPGDTAVLVVTIDAAAPKGRLILPQVQTLRDLLDHDAIAIVCKENKVKEAVHGQDVKIVITDSQVFAQVEAQTPPDVLLTSFSILFARQKGDLLTLAAGAQAIDNLRPGDKVLVAEACTHHRVEDDIGRVKLPRLLQQRVGGKLQFSFSSGTTFPEDLPAYNLILHCGGCMINRRAMLARIAQAKEAGVPIVNYGVAIAHLLGILPRALSPFPEIGRKLFP